MAPPPDHCPALVLNADFRPLSYFPLSLWSWQETVKAVFLDRVNIISEYDRVVRSPNFEIKLPSVISLKEYIPATRRPAFTRFNVFLRDRFSCQYCNEPFPTQELTFDHVIPRSKGGRTTWENVVTSCSACNLRKGNRLPQAMRHDTTYSAVPTNGVSASGKRTILPAKLLARKSAAFSLLGYRT